MFNYTANVNAQQVNNARSKGSGSLIGNMSCTTRVINITDVIIPCISSVLYLGTSFFCYITKHTAATLNN